ncbi:hypothetical protein E0H39_23840 [Rhizobium leguminosarum bv. viciae]|nr:hypothetical protein ELH19_14910 [Rhizobium ruizarguesonis]TBY60661.1 hypothetical protein E0H39_23840 [Rhizobium leguminosarum bv. viciae]
MSELHSKAFQDFLPSVTLQVKGYDPRDKALIVWRNLQLIACISDDRLEQFQVVNINREIRKQAQFTLPQTDTERRYLSISSA